jgi:hypothetical protein
MATIVVQAGHHGRSTGVTGTSGLDADPTEQEFTIAAARACAHLLNAAGHVAHVVAADIPNQAYRGDAFVAIHCDGSTDQSARGASVGYRTPEGQRLATAFKHAYQAAGWTGGWRPDNYTPALAGYYGTKRAIAQGNRTAFVAESGFLTNRQDEALLSFPHGPNRCAHALTVAVVEILGGQPPKDDDDMPLTEPEWARLQEKLNDSRRAAVKSVDERIDALEGRIDDIVAATVTRVLTTEGHPVRTAVRDLAHMGANDAELDGA